MKEEVNFTTLENCFPFQQSNGVFKMLSFTEGNTVWNLDLKMQNRYKMIDLSSIRQSDMIYSLSFLPCFPFIVYSTHVILIDLAKLSVPIKTLNEIWKCFLFLQRRKGLKGVGAVGGRGSEVGRVIVLGSLDFRQGRGSLILATTDCFPEVFHHLFFFFPLFLSLMSIS